MTVVMMASEMTPFAKTGGLADVAGALRAAFYELNAIRARDGAPQHIAWYRGHPIQTDSCTHEYFSAVVDACEAALPAAEALPELLAALEYYADPENIWSGARARAALATVRGKA